MSKLLDVLILDYFSSLKLLRHSFYNKSMRSTGHHYMMKLNYKRLCLIKYKEKSKALLLTMLQKKTQIMNGELG